MQAWSGNVWLTADGLAAALVHHCRRRPAAAPLSFLIRFRHSTLYLRLRRLERCKRPRGAGPNASCPPRAPATTSHVSTVGRGSNRKLAQSNVSCKLHPSRCRQQRPGAGGPSAGHTMRSRTSCCCSSALRISCVRSLILRQARETAHVPLAVKTLAGCMALWGPTRAPSSLHRLSI